MILSLDCPLCGAESTVELDYVEFNYDERDGYRDLGWIAEVQSRGCDCETVAQLEESAIRTAEQERFGC